MQTIDLILGYLASYLSEMIPPVIAEMNPPMLTTAALRIK